MIVANFDNITYVSVSPRKEGGVTINFVDGNSLLLFGEDATTVKNKLKTLVRSHSMWNKVSWDVDDTK